MAAEQSSRPMGFNEKIIEEFRANAGKVGGRFAGATMLLLTTTGARTGEPHTVPLVAIELEGTTVVVASKGGADTHPDWYRNIRNKPEVTVEIGTGDGIERYEAAAEIPSPEDRDRLFAAVVERAPGYGDYQAGTERIIPVVRLRRS